jgi:hypothetical protein
MISKHDCVIYHSRYLEFLTSLVTKAYRGKTSLIRACFLVTYMRCLCFIC